jgi:hypothetical protein
MSTPEYNSRQSGDSTMGSSYGAASDVYSSIEGPTFADKPIGGGANGQLVGAQVRADDKLPTACSCAMRCGLRCARVRSGTKIPHHARSSTRSNRHPITWIKCRTRRRFLLCRY